MVRIVVGASTVIQHEWCYLLSMRGLRELQRMNGVFSTHTVVCRRVLCLLNVCCRYAIEDFMRIVAVGIYVYCREVGVNLGVNEYCILYGGCLGNVSGAQASFQ